jgi:epoxyqueuosine reductase QueG
MPKDKHYAGLKDFSLSLGCDLFGVADIREEKKEFTLPKSLLEKIDKAVVLGIGLCGLLLEDIENSPTPLYFNHYKTLNAALDQAALKVANFIQKDGFLALPVPASQILDWQNQTAHLSHKKIGVLAGLGWIGRNNLLVNKELGSQFRLVTILTNMPLAVDEPLKSDCQGCVSCITICPAKAIEKDSRDFNHKKCFEKLKEFQKIPLVDQYICGLCVKACKGK